MHTHWTLYVKMEYFRRHTGHSITRVLEYLRSEVYFRRFISHKRLPAVEANGWRSVKTRYNDEFPRKRDDFQCTRGDDVNASIENCFNGRTIKNHQGDGGGWLGLMKRWLSGLWVRGGGSIKSGRIPEFLSEQGVSRSEGHSIFRGTWTSVRLKKGENASATSRLVEHVKMNVCK